MITSSGMIFYVFLKSVFNNFADLPIPMDRWSVIDLFCALTNIICLSLIYTISKEDVIDTTSKIKYNIFMLMTVFATWSRIIGIALVVPNFSELIMTIYVMLGSATTFLMIVGYYLIMMSIIAMAVFQESVEKYMSFFYILRAMFDAMMGAYDYSVVPEFQKKEDKFTHTVFLFIHIYIANIFMLNYLVAILSTVYSEMMELNEFLFNCNKYLYIERYLIA